MKVSIIKYNAGNVLSVANALKRQGIEPILTDDPEVLKTSDKVVFPGVGEASSAMNYLKDRGLDLLIRDLQQPTLGICLGLQLLCRFSEENNTDGLGIFDLMVRKFPPENKVPHMGWNTITHSGDPLFRNLGSSAYLYFVHSYYAEVGHSTIGQTDYILSFSSALHKNNFYAIQAHPEKSGKAGEKILENFLSL